MCIAARGKVLTVARGYARVDFGKDKKEVLAEPFKPKAGDRVLVFGNRVIEIIKD